MCLLLLFRPKGTALESQSEVQAIFGQLCVIDFYPRGMFLILLPFDFIISLKAEAIL